VRINEKLLERNNTCSGLENCLIAVGFFHADHEKPFYPQKLELKFG
jgi:hypothetical protein